MNVEKNDPHTRYKTEGMKTYLTKNGMKGKINFKPRDGSALANNSKAGMSVMQSRVWFVIFAGLEPFSYKILRVYYFSMFFLQSHSYRRSLDPLENVERSTIKN